MLATFLVLVITVTVTYARWGPSLSGLLGSRPNSGFMDPASASAQLYGGLDKEVDIPANSLAPLFATSSTPAPPQIVIAPPLGPLLKAATASTTSLPLADHVDVRTSGNIPDDFKTFAGDAVVSAIARFDAFYKDPTFSFAAQTKAAHFGLLITTDRASFAALAHTTSFRSGFMDPCPNATQNRNLCIPVVMLYFDPSQWSGGEYPPMSQPRIEHEVFHVAHFYILRSLGHADLFSIPGYYWQTEGFATFTQRNIPDQEAYLTFTTKLLGLGFFSWPSITDKSYEDSYAAAPFLDEMVFQSGNNPSVLLSWLRSAQAGDPSSLSLMTSLAAGPNNTINISKFQRLWLGSMVDLYYPGLLPSTDARTVSVGPALPSPSASIGKDAPAVASIAVPPIGVKEMSLAIASLPDDPNKTDLNLSLNSDMPANQRALIMLVKGDQSDNLPFCYQRLASAGAKAVSEAQQCISNHVRLLDVVARGGNQSLKVSIAAIKSFTPDLTKASIVVFVAHTIADVNDSDLQPMHVTLTAATDLPASSQATLDLTATGDVNGHMTADKLVVAPGSDGTCRVNDGILNLYWQPNLAGQDYMFGVGVTYSGPGTYEAGNGASLFLNRLGHPETVWSYVAGAGSVTVNGDGRSGSFSGALNYLFNPYNEPSHLHVSGTFACATPIR